MMRRSFVVALVALLGLCGVHAEKREPVVVHFEGRDYDFRTLPRTRGSDEALRARGLGTRIVGGSTVTSGRLFQAILWKLARDANGNVITNGDGVPLVSFACGGSLITPTTILTAAHCLPGFVAAEVGDYTPFDLPYTGDYVSVVEEVGHVAYNDFTKENDIAILRLSASITSFPTITLIFQSSSYNALDDTGAQLRVTGWGATSSGGPTSNVLLEALVPVISNAACGASNSYGSGFKPATMICAGVMAGGRDSCQGDSGGPLFGAVGGVDVQVGVVSWGNGCASPNFPGVYTRLTTYESWLRTNVPGLPAAGPSPTPKPTNKPSTAQPTSKPSTAQPTAKPSTAQPTAKPSTAQPAVKPTTAQPAVKPTMAQPTMPQPSAKPTAGAVLTTQSPTQPSPPTVASAPAASSGSNMPLIVGAGGGALVFMAAAVAIATTAMRRRRARALGGSPVSAFATSGVVGKGPPYATQVENPRYGW